MKENSLYKGKQRFTREQAIFVVECALIGALDGIESSLPACITWADRKDQANAVDNDPLKLTAYDRGALECTGMMLGVFYAQLTGDGLGIYDALYCTKVDDLNFNDALERLVREAWKDEGKRIEARQKEIANSRGGGYTIEQLYEGLWPDTRKYAEAFVAQVFTDHEDLE